MFNGHQELGGKQCLIMHCVDGKMLAVRLIAVCVAKRKHPPS